MAAKKSKGLSQIVSVVFTTLLAPLAVSVFSSSIKNERPPAIEERPIVFRPIVTTTSLRSEPPVVLLPPIGATVSAYRDIRQEVARISQ